jgi:translation initiation factor 4G
MCDEHVDQKRVLVLGTAKDLPKTTTVQPHAMYSSKSIPPSLPSALATARIIDDIGQITYPEGIRSPKMELNINAKGGKFK